MPCLGPNVSLVPGGAGQACRPGAQLKPSRSGYYITETGRALGTAAHSWQRRQDSRRPRFQIAGTPSTAKTMAPRDCHPGEGNNSGHLTLVTSSNGCVGCRTTLPPPTPTTIKVQASECRTAGCGHEKKEKLARFCFGTGSPASQAGLELVQLRITLNL